MTGGSLITIQGPRLKLRPLSTTEIDDEWREMVEADPMTMAMLIAVFDLAWYLLLATAVARVQRGYRSRFQRWTERITGGVLIALGVRMSVERR